MKETTKLLRLHQEIYLPLWLASKAAECDLEDVVEVAFRRFSRLSLGERTRTMYAFHESSGFSTKRARLRQGRSWRNTLRSVIAHVRQRIRRLLRLGNT